MTRAESVRVAYPLFQVGGGGSTPTSALQLLIEPISFQDARVMNQLWHSRLPAIRAANGVIATSICFGAEFDGRWFAVAIWTNPVAANLPQKEWLELRRLAIAPDAPKNTASRMLGIMTRLIRKERPQLTNLVSYQDTEVHTGSIYKAAGWKATRLSKGDDWTGRKGRDNRTHSQSTSPKQRWELSLIE